MNQVSPTAVIRAPVRFVGSWPQIASPPYRYVSPIARWSSPALGVWPCWKLSTSAAIATIVPRTPMARRRPRPLMAGTLTHGIPREEQG